MEELRTEMRQMLLMVMEANHHPPVMKQRPKGCQKCRSEGAGENCPHCFKCGQEGHFSRGCRVQRQFLVGGTTSSPGQRVPKPAEICQLDIVSDNAQRHSSSSEHNPVPTLQAPITAGRTGWEKVYCQLFYRQLSSESIMGGAQSCIINEPWRQQHLPHTVIRPITELLEGNTLTVLAANDTLIAYVGWIEVSFRLGDGRNELQVPILVYSNPAVASDPIIAYNVVEAVINGEETKTKGERRQLLHKVSKALSITVQTAQNVGKLMQSGSDPDTGVARTVGKRVHLPANQVSTIYVRAHVNARARGQDMLFTPDMLNAPPEGVSLSEVLVRIPKRKVTYIPAPLPTPLTTPFIWN